MKPLKTLEQRRLKFMKSKRQAKKIKTIKRVYVSKKTGKKKTYTYEYETFNINGKTVHRSRRNVVFRGKITKYGKEWLEKYKKNLDISDANDIERYVLSAEREGRTLKASSAISHLQENKTARFIYNMGGNIDDLAEEMGVTYEDLVNDKHWDFNKSEFTVNGVTYRFTFEYREHNIIWEIV